MGWKYLGKVPQSSTWVQYLNKRSYFDSLKWYYSAVSSPLAFHSFSSLLSLFLFGPRSVFCSELGPKFSKSDIIQNKNKTPGEVEHENTEF